MRAIVIAAALLGALSLAACKPPVKEYEYPQFGFRASFPSPPKVTDKPAAGDEVHATIVESISGGRDLAVWVGDAAQVSNDVDEITDHALPQIASGLGGEAGVRTYVATSDGVMGREIPIKKDDKLLMRVRIYLAGGRAYELLTRSALGPNDPAITAFLDSFHIVPGAPALPTNSAPVHDTAVEDALARQTNEANSAAKP